MIGSVIDDNLIGPSYHHQAVKDIADALEIVAMSKDEIIKATQANDGKKIMLCQFHPEYQADKNSVNILDKFIDLSSEQKAVSKVLEITDILNFNDTIVRLEESTKLTNISETTYENTYLVNTFLASLTEEPMLEIMV